MSIKKVSPFILSCLLVACGGGSSDSTNEKATTTLPEITPEVEEVTYTGFFLDSAVSGLNYTTSAEQGVTNAAGEFHYYLNDTVAFSLGDIRFPEITAKSILTPLDVFATSDINNIAVVNMLRLLQTLDQDGDLTNGINITSQAHEQANGLNVDFSSSDFDTQVTELVNNSGALNTQLVSESEAIFHFQETLNAIDNQAMTGCEKTHARVGQSGFFMTYSHNVSGKAEVIDDCTIKISQFSYDGGGPLVYFYAAIDHNYDSDSAFAMGNLLTGTVFNDDEIILKLPNGKTLDDLNGLSVWCIDFKANFGDLTFSP